jgi:hypothetical protein
MTEVNVSQITDIEDPTLRAFAEKVADGLIAAGLKAAAHHAEPKKFKLARGRSLERSFLGYLRSRPLQAQQRIAAKSLPIVAGKKVKGLEGVDLRAGKPVFDLAMARVKLGALDRKKGFAKREKAILEDGERGFRKQSSPDRLCFDLLSVKCIDETNGFLGSEAGSDEIAFGGVMVDAGGNTISIPRVRVGDFSKDGVTKNYDPPRPFASMDFRSGDGWPKTFTLVLTLVELDNGNFPELLERLYNETRDRVSSAVQAWASGAGPTIGEAIGAAVSWVLNKVFGWLKDWWEDDLFKPLTVTFDFGSANARWGGQSETGPLWMEWWGHGGRYKLWYKARLDLASEAAQEGGAIVYQHANYGGRAVKLGAGHYTLAQLRARGMGNDMISSLKVGAGMRAIAYQHNNFSGTARIFTGSVPYVGRSFNDQTSSIVIEPTRVMLFQHSNYRGNSQSFAPGRYDLGQITIGNDQASSILVPPGYKVTLYQHARFKGTKKVFTADANYVGNDFNDVVSSLIVELI